MRDFLMLGIAVLLLNHNTAAQPRTNPSVGYTRAQDTVKDENQRPNIVWIVCEDIGLYIGAYRYKGVKTPNIDNLAKEELYTRAYTTAGVCAPSRSTFITGMNQTAIGTMHMRTLNEDNPSNSLLPSCA